MATNKQSKKDDLMNIFMWEQLLKYDLPEDARAYAEQVIKFYQDRIEVGR